MCLQWCHVRRLLIDNDLPCSGCSRFPIQQLPHDEQCSSCCHRREQQGAVFCGLSQMPLPRAGRCCHWNCCEDTRQIITLTDADVAPEVLAIWDVRQVGDLFAQSDTAPDYEQQGDAVRVNLWDLALPLVYGVPAAHWEYALEQTPWPNVVQLPPELASAVITLLEAEPAQTEQARCTLQALLVQYPLDTLPSAWQTLVHEALAVL